MHVAVNSLAACNTRCHTRRFNGNAAAAASLTPRR